MVKGSYISIITLNVNEFYAPTKRHGLVEWIQKHELCISCLQETHFRLRDTYRLKVRGWKKILCKWKLKAGVAILILDKIDFKIKTITRDKEGHTCGKVWIQTKLCLITRLYLNFLLFCPFLSLKNSLGLNFYCIVDRKTCPHSSTHCNLACASLSIAFS